VLTVGSDVAECRPGQRVVVPFQISCGVCTACSAGRTGRLTTRPTRVSPVGGRPSTSNSESASCPKSHKSRSSVPATADSWCSRRAGLRPAGDRSSCRRWSASRSRGRTRRIGSAGTPPVHAVGSQRGDRRVDANEQPSAAVAGPDVGRAWVRARPARRCGCRSDGLGLEFDSGLTSSRDCSSVACPAVSGVHLRAT
jgi:hypothetical protein